MKKAVMVQASSIEHEEKGQSPHKFKGVKDHANSIELEERGQGPHMFNGVFGKGSRTKQVQ